MQAAIAVRERAEQELRERPALVDQVGPCQPPPRLGERREREAVPGGDRLVVEPGLWARRADLEEPGAKLLVQLASQDEAAVLERLEQLLGRALSRGPGVREPFDAVRVGVLGGREAAVGEAEVAQQVLDCPLGHVAVALACR